MCNENQKEYSIAITVHKFLQILVSWHHLQVTWHQTLATSLTETLRARHQGDPGAARSLPRWGEFSHLFDWLPHHWVSHFYDIMHLPICLTTKDIAEYLLVWSAWFIPRKLRNRSGWEAREAVPADRTSGLKEQDSVKGQCHRLVSPCSHKVRPQEPQGWTSMEEWLTCQRNGRISKQIFITNEPVVHLHVSRAGWQVLRAVEGLGRPLGTWRWARC